MEDPKKVVLDNGSQCTTTQPLKEVTSVITKSTLPGFKNLVVTIEEASLSLPGKDAANDTRLSTRVGFDGTTTTYHVSSQNSSIVANTGVVSNTISDRIVNAIGWDGMRNGVVAGSKQSLQIASIAMGELGISCTDAHGDPTVPNFTPNDIRNIGRASQIKK
jgi:hypothetical protein